MLGTSIYTPKTNLEIGVILGEILEIFGIFRFFGRAYSEISAVKNMGRGCGLAANVSV